MRTKCQLGWILASKIHQNLLLDGSWAVLWQSWAVLGRLVALLRRLEEAPKSDAKKSPKKKAGTRRLGGILGRPDGFGRSGCGGGAAAVGGFQVP